MPFLEGHPALHDEPWLADDAVVPRRTVRRSLSIAAAAALCLALLAISLDRYGPVDPTDPGWKVRITNDTSEAVTVATSTESLKLPPAGSEIFVAPGPGKLRFTATVRHTPAAPVTCLPVALSKHRTVEASVSDAKPC